MVCKIGFANWNAKIALLRASMVVTYYIKLFRTVTDRHNGILISLLLLVAETITILNRLGISISYDKLERIDFTLTNRLLKGLGEYRVPISNSINKSLLHGAMDNFDCIEDTKLGTGRSHDTILTVFQNQKEKNDTIVFLLRIKMTEKMNDLLIQSLDVKRFFLFMITVELK